MSDIDTILMDAAWDDYQNRLQYEKEMVIATLQQCIYLLVEGETEERTYPGLLKRCEVDIEELGIIIGNYNGIGNLIHSLRLLKKTLSHDRPVIATYDNDEEGKMFLRKLSKVDFNNNLVTLVPMPSIKTPIEYSDGHKGGSFEEMFSVHHFLDQAFSSDCMPHSIVDAKKEFRKHFDKKQNWFAQVRNFLISKGKTDIDKVSFGIRLAKTCNKVPRDIRKLAKTLCKTRKKYPVRHLSDIAQESFNEERTPMLGSRIH